jgi:hypothetical protein
MGEGKALHRSKEMNQPTLVTDYSLRDRTRMVLALAQFRKEWQELKNGRSLLNVESPVGLLLADIADVLELTPEERHVVLGGRLINEVYAFRETRVSIKLHN